MHITLLSPFSGRAVPLSSVPDPVFAGSVLGDGLAVDPCVGELRAPCDGVVVAPHASGHALTVRSPEGMELLMHIGIETVSLHGAGFSLLVAEGENVRAGQCLVRFDLAAIRPRVPSLVSMMLVANGDAFAVESVTRDGNVAFGESVLTATSLR